MINWSKGMIIYMSVMMGLTIASFVVSYIAIGAKGLVLCAINVILGALAYLIVYGITKGIHALYYRFVHDKK